MDTLVPCLRDALRDAGIVDLFPVQRAVLPLALAGRDVLVRSYTGSGKTLAYVLPILHRLLTSPPPPRPPQSCYRRGVLRALVLVPTRDVAIQVIGVITDVTSRIVPRCDIDVSSAIGGEAPDSANVAPWDADILVATPGRLLALISASKLSLEHVQFLVVDEADRLLGDRYQEWPAAVMRAAHNTEAGRADEDAMELDARTCRLPHPHGRSRARMTCPLLFPTSSFAPLPPPMVTGAAPQLQKMLFSATLVESARKLLPLRLCNPWRFDGADTRPDAAPVRMDAPADEDAEAEALAEEMALSEETAKEADAAADDQKQPANEGPTEMERQPKKTTPAAVKGAMAPPATPTPSAPLERKFSLPPNLVERFIKCKGMNRETWLTLALSTVDKASKALVFVRNAEELARIEEFLRALAEAEGSPAGSVRPYVSSMTLEEREDVLNGFRDGKVRIVVSTDVLARGIDLPNVDVVINLYPPLHAQSYVHRAGRTARAGRSGLCITLMVPQDRPRFKEMMAEIGTSPKEVKFSKAQVQAVFPTYETASRAVWLAHRGDRRQENPIPHKRPRRENYRNNSGNNRAPPQHRQQRERAPTDE